MAIRRKGQESKGLPSGLVALVTEAATYKATSDFFTALYDGGERCSDAEKAASAKGRLQVYLDDEECPVQVSVGAGGGVKVPGVGSLSFSQPERVDNEAAIAAIVAALKDGSLQPDALAEVISTVSKEGLLKALPTVAPTVIKTQENVTTTLRIAGDFRAEVCERLAEQVEAAKAPAEKAA